MSKAYKQLTKIVHQEFSGTETMTKQIRSLAWNRMDAGQRKNATDRSLAALIPEAASIAIRGRELSRNAKAVRASGDDGSHDAARNMLNARRQLLGKAA